LEETNAYDYNLYKNICSNLEQGQFLLCMYM
jgi:hypothetical protein